MGERNAIRKIEYIITAITISCALLLCALFLIGCGNENDGYSDGSYVVSYTCAPLGGRIDGRSGKARV